MKKGDLIYYEVVEDNGEKCLGIHVYKSNSESYLTIYFRQGKLIGTNSGQLNFTFDGAMSPSRVIKIRNK